MQYCPNCGKIHEITTSNQCSYTCPNNYYPTTLQSAPYYTPSTVESRLDRIIDLLEQLLIKGAK